ncbi:hypothetical protein LOY46_17030 [Pseudomonas sichuanensis]|uniref:hypothetical protein n=1 Tax=Pseudomonas sichuanensis TaxID=2213015 RepID=UPI002160D644|nr:hypothetical protein [Pseudomonas sichuanensis]UVK81272.1 hypothetical protein LOY46_17030 [Pseudomonas sichuanensis]
MTDFIDDEREHEPEREYDGDFAIEDDDEEQGDPFYESPYDDDEEEDEYEKDNREGWEHNIEKWNDL